MIIGIDIDGTINNLGETVLKVYNRDSGDNLQMKDIKKYHIENYVKPQYKDNFYKYFSSGEVWRQIEFIPRCKEFISKLFNDGHTIYFITKTEPRNFFKKASWLERNFPYLDIRKCFFNCPNKKLMNIDVMIDAFGGLPNRRTACHRLYVTGGCKFPTEFETGSHCQ